MSTSAVRFRRYGSVSGCFEPLTLRFEGDHLLREPLEHLRTEGFEVEQRLRSKLRIVERIAARKPSQPS